MCSNASGRLEWTRAESLGQDWTLRDCRRPRIPRNCHQTATVKTRTNEGWAVDDAVAVERTEPDLAIYRDGRRGTGNMLRPRAFADPSDLVPKSDADQIQVDYENPKGSRFTPLIWSSACLA